ncbi:DUF47 family protein [Candidatus Woesearchaeota archaeon]|nr:DUF47 family protein [Candidatus Woesearchaeota archaeon]
MYGIMRWLMPRDEKFFEMLLEQAEIALQGAKELKDFVENYSNLDRNWRKSKSQLIREIEHKGDKTTHKLIEKLNKSFITPIDKEDIHQMAVLLDDVIDLINAVVLRFSLLGIERIDICITELVEIIYKSVAELNKSISDLRKMKDMKEYYIKIHSLENEADEVYYKGIDELFHFYKNPIDIMKYKEIYELLESVTDKCEDITNVIEGIVVKHA